MAETYLRVNLTAPGIQLEGQARTTIGVADQGRGKWLLQSASGELGRGVLAVSDSSKKRYFIPLEKIDYVEFAPVLEKEKAK